MKKLLLTVEQLLVLVFLLLPFCPLSFFWECQLFPATNCTAKRSSFERTSRGAVLPRKRVSFDGRPTPNFDLQTWVRPTQGRVAHGGSIRRWGSVSALVDAELRLETCYLKLKTVPERKRPGSRESSTLLIFSFFFQSFWLLPNLMASEIFGH